MDLSADLEAFRRAARQLRELGGKGIGYAARNGLNDAAFEARKLWTAGVKRTMTLRNTWTVRSLRVDKAQGRELAWLQARVGSTAPYMVETEHGAIERKNGKHGVAIPTSPAAGQARGATPRKRLVRRPNRMPNIDLPARVSGLSRKARNALAIRMARKASAPFAFLDLGRRKGIFRITGKRTLRVTMLWDLSRPSVNKPAMKLLDRALDEVTRRLPAIHRKRIEEQLRRYRLGAAR